MPIYIVDTEDLLASWRDAFGREASQLLHTIDPQQRLSQYPTGCFLIPAYGGKFDNTVFDGSTPFGYGYAGRIQVLLDNERDDARSIRLGRYWFPPGDDRSVRDHIDKTRLLLKGIFRIVKKRDIKLERFTLPDSMEQHTTKGRRSLETFFHETRKLATMDSLGIVQFRGFSANPMQTSIKLTEYAKVSKISKIDIDHTFPRHLLHSSFVTNANLSLIIVSIHERGFDIEHWATCFGFMEEWANCRAQRDRNGMRPIQLRVCLEIDTWRNNAWTRYIQDLNSLAVPVSELQIEYPHRGFLEMGTFEDSVANTVANLHFSANRKVSNLRSSNQRISFQQMNPNSTRVTK